MDTFLSWKPLNSPRFRIMKRDILYKRDGTAFAEIQRHAATACVTQSLHYIIVDIGPH